MTNKASPKSLKERSNNEIQPYQGMEHDDSKPNIHISINATVSPLRSKDSKDWLAKKEKCSVCAGNNEQWHKHNNTEAKNKGMFQYKTGGRKHGERGGGNITMMQNGILGK